MDLDNILQSEDILKSKDQPSLILITFDSKNKIHTPL